MSTCRVCGENDHLASKCSELFPPSNEMYTGPGCGADEDDHDHDAIILSYGKMQHGQNNLMDGAFLSKLQELGFFLYTFPSKLSNVVELGEQIQDVQEHLYTEFDE